MAWAITTKQSRYTDNIGYRHETKKKKNDIKTQNKTKTSKDEQHGPRQKKKKNTKNTKKTKNKTTTGVKPGVREEYISSSCFL